ncbi:MAG TPA: carbon-nitrogen hydrolase family protein [Vicinamibacteria bacterium]|nr:carbon-nitrogen hydrolase family protein [Vicinamibacteria bacterium]
MSAFVSSLLAAALPFAQSGFSGTDTAWHAVAARPEIAPRAFVADAPSRGAPGALALAGDGNPAASGGWERRLDGVEAGRWYRLRACYRAEQIAHESWQVLARLDWLDAKGARAGQPDYAWQVEDDAGWRRLTLEAPAPQGAQAVAVQLQLRDAGKGVVYWDDVRVEEVPAPAPRRVTVAAVNLRPRGTASAADSVRSWIATAADDVPPGADVILLSEGIPMVGTGKPYVEVSEAVPGPTTTALGGLARQKHAWVVAGLYEREGAIVYNTAVLIDREGRLAGRYRKVYLPREEVEGGLTAGSAYPVFRTDFGTVGLMVCWDTNFADPARALALAGAEVLLVPIAGGNETLVHARAIENRVFVATSGYDIATEIVDPDGKTLARAVTDGTVAVATIDLARRYTDPWLGDMRARLRKELRTEVPATQP